MSVSSDEIFVIVVLGKKHGQGTCSLQISYLSCCILVALVVVALCDVGL